jgi:hypothetical protein
MAYDPTGTWPTLYNLTKQLDPDGTLADIGAVYSRTEAILDDIPFFEANGKTFHRITVEDGMPSGTWRKINKGITATDSGTLQVDETIGLLENRAEADLVLARMSNDIPKFRKQKADRIVRGLAYQLATTFFYGDTATYPERFHGFSPRYDALAAKTDTFGANTMGMLPVVSAGGSSSGAMSSIFLVGWGEGKVYGIYPQGSPMGIEQEDLGVIDLYDADGGVFRGYAEHFRVQQGLAVEDWRYVARLCNIDPAATINDAACLALLNGLIDLTYALPSLTDCRPVFYANRKIFAHLTKLAYVKTNLALNIGEVYGEKNILNINGIPLRQSDSIVMTEATIS